MNKNTLGKVGLDLMIRHMTANNHSHEASWIYLRCNQLRNLGIDAEVIHDSIGDASTYDAWSRYDTIFIYHSMAAVPELYNAFGSVASKVTDNIEQLRKRKSEPPVNVYDIGYDKAALFFNRLIWPQHKNIHFVSLDFPMIPYGTRCSYKSGRPGTSEAWTNTDWKAVQDKCDSIVDWCIDPFYTYTDQIVNMTMGDSHAHSVYKPSSAVLRKDGRTMHAINKRGLEKELTDAGFDMSRIGQITSYYGNIDIRHHLCRQDNPVEATKKLLREYEETLKRVNRSIEIVTPLPIEDESRQIPNMGYYKGSPFYGSRTERQELVKHFIHELEEMSVRNNWKLFSWPKEWYEMDGVEFFELMERPRSVHLAWKYYRWDLKNNCLNDNYKALDCTVCAKPTLKIDLLEF